MAQSFILAFNTGDFSDWANSRRAARLSKAKWAVVSKLVLVGNQLPLSLPR